MQSRSLVVDPLCMFTGALGSSGASRAPHSMVPLSHDPPTYCLPVSCFLLLPQIPLPKWEKWIEK